MVGVSEEPLHSEKMLATVVESVAVMLIVFGGVVPYVPQYLDIKRSNNAEGFSTFVCLTLLVANILRITFWFGHPFELPLLVQSFVMTVTMLVMVHVCMLANRSSEILGGKKKYLTDFVAEDFWRWTDFFSYVQFLVFFSLVIAAFTYIFIENIWFVESLGFLAVFFEAMLGVPQFYRNFQNQSTKGMSVKMVLMWTMGDIFKTLYFLIRRAPVQFWICGTFQVVLDFSILSQVLYYGSRPTVIRLR